MATVRKEVSCHLCEMFDDLEYLFGELSAGTDDESVGTLVSIERQPGLLITATHYGHLFYFCFYFKGDAAFYPGRTAKKGEKIRDIFFLFFYQKDRLVGLESDKLVRYLKSL